MYLKKTKPFINSKRFESKVFYLNKIFKFKKHFFFSYIKNIAGRCYNSGKTVIYSKTRSKKKIFYSSNSYFKEIKKNALYLIISLKRNSNKLISIVKDNLNQIKSIPFINGTFLGDYFYFIFKINKVLISLGKKTFLLFSLNSFFISNICNSCYSKKSSIATSNGTYCLKKNSIIDYKIIVIILPSKKKKLLFFFDTCFIGRNSNIDWKYKVIGNYKNNFLKKKKQSVRGVAMNPVDHPHGGRTKTNKPEVSPWGWVTKKSH